MKKTAVIFMMIALLVGITGCSSVKDDVPFDQANPAGKYGSIMETENGFYYNRIDETYAHGMELRYYDKSSGKDIILCNKPECPHENYPFCASTGSGKLVHAALYKNFIYTVRMIWENKTFSVKLFRTSLDGTELTEIATVYEQKQDEFYIYSKSRENYYMAIYNDTAFFRYSREQESGFDNLGLAMVDLKTGKVKIFEELSSKKSQGYQKLIPYEKYLYYYISDNRNNDLRLYRYDLASEKSEPLEITENWRDYCIVGGKVVFLRYDGDENARLYTLDPDTSEITPLSGALTDENGECIIKPHNGVLLYDGERFTVGNELGSYNYRDHYIYDGNGGLLARVTAPDGEERYGKKSNINDNSLGYGDIHIVNDKLYFVNYYEALCCPMSDILAGNIHWETAYKIHEQKTEGADQ